MCACRFLNIMEYPAVISGDSLVLRGNPGPQGQLPKERSVIPCPTTCPHRRTYITSCSPQGPIPRRHLRAPDGQRIPGGRGAQTPLPARTHTHPLTPHPPHVQEWAFESREFLRALAVGKPIAFTPTHALPPNDDVPRDIGSAEIGGADLAAELLRNGWARLKDLKRDPTEEDLRKRELESEAKAAGKGIWNPHGPKVSSCGAPAPFQLY